MRIIRIEIGGFGRLEGLDTGPDPLGGLVVVSGPNEAGKSTMFEFLTTSLYGFQPASRERNTHVPWGTDEASGSVRLRLADGTCAEVERRLRSQPVARLSRGGRASDLRNQALPWVEHVPRTVFRQVFAITLAELTGLDGETWARIQDKVVGSMGASDLGSPREIADRLEREAGEIWRPNRRGNQRLRELRATLLALREARREARVRDERIRECVDAGLRLRRRIEEARARRQSDRELVERVQTLLPVQRTLDRIASLRATAGDPGLLESLPADPVGTAQRLQRELRPARERLQRLEAEHARLGHVVNAFDDRARDLLAGRARVAEVATLAVGAARDRALVAELDAGVADLDVRAEATAARIMDRPWPDLDPTELARFPVDVLADRLERGRSGSEQRLGPARRRAGPLSLAALAVGAGVAAWGLAMGWAWVLALGIAMAAAGGAVFFRRAGRVDVSRSRDDTEVLSLLGALPVQRVHRERPGDDLVDGLRRLQELARSRIESESSMRAAARRIAAADETALDVSRGLARASDGDAEAIAHELGSELREAERLQSEAGLARREVERISAERADAAAAVAEIERGLGGLRSAAAAFGSGDVEAGLREAGYRMESLERSARIEEELEREHPDLDEIRRRLADPVAGGAELVGPEELATIRTRIESADEEIEKLVEEREALEAEAGHLRTLDTADAVDGAIASLKEEEARLVRERDRKWVLARLLREADRRFREEHQPDLVRRAGSYLAHLTDGRYERLVVDETDASRLFRLVGPGLPAPVPLAPPVSTGTLEQAYLSIRLAIVDHLDQGGERLPLFIDEAFVNWDPARRDRGLQVLESLSKTRQVFFFTCHPRVADALVARGGSLISLGSSG